MASHPAQHVKGLTLEGMPSSNDGDRLRKAVDRREITRFRADRLHVRAAGVAVCRESDFTSDTRDAGRSQNPMCESGSETRKGSRPLSACNSSKGVEQVSECLSCCLRSVGRPRYGTECGRRRAGSGLSAKLGFHVVSSEASIKISQASRAVIGKPRSRQRWNPPRSGRTRVTPIRLSRSAARALDASFGQEQ